MAETGCAFSSSGLPDSIGDQKIADSTDRHT